MNILILADLSSLKRCCTGFIDTYTCSRIVYLLFEARAAKQPGLNAQRVLLQNNFNFLGFGAPRVFDQSTGTAVAPGADWKYYPFDDSPHACGNAIALRYIQDLYYIQTIRNSLKL